MTCQVLAYIFRSLCKQAAGIWDFGSGIWNFGSGIWVWVGSGILDLDEITINLACAHPAKFPDAIKKAIGHFPTFPEELKQVINKKECFEVMENDDNMVMEYIVNSIS